MGEGAGITLACGWCNVLLFMLDGKKLIENNAEVQLEKGSLHKCNQ